MNELLRLLADARAREIEIWACLAHELTVRARGAYPLPDHPWNASHTEMLRTMNELMHRITAQIGSVAASSGKQFPAHELALVLRELAAMGHVGHELERAGLAVSRRLSAGEGA